eukprot:GHVR01134655.1.p1 GENE.GHVR01134655.1~~GHVR01134655.1.p1  ORF type:complete len:126 (-),score=24.59 GHVR01134655.1:421-798(-)
MDKHPRTCVSQGGGVHEYDDSILVIFLLLPQPAAPDITRVIQFGILTSFLESLSTFRGGDTALLIIEIINHRDAQGDFKKKKLYKIYLLRFLENIKNYIYSSKVKINFMFNISSHISSQSHLVEP